MFELRTEWLKKRLGKFTASDIWKLTKEGKKKGVEFGDTAMTYIHSKVAEIITGEIVELPDLKQLQWGNANENDAILTYEHVTGNKVQYFGGADPQYFPYNAYSGGSPDGLQGEDATIEAKCPFNSANHIKFLIGSLDENPAQWLKDNKEEYYAQLQFNLLATKRTHAVFISYDPRTVEHSHRLAIIQVPANTEYQNMLIRKLEMAKDIVVDMLEKLERKPLIVTGETINNHSVLIVDKP
ncbi:YqaJ viral recombinase family protein [Nostoc linckia]|nr:YqaJ viral recombinase family protein [Nostoc linckia]